MQLPVAQIPPVGDGWTAVARRQEVVTGRLSTGGLSATGALLAGWQVPSDERWQVERLVVTCDYAGAITCAVYTVDIPGLTSDGAALVELLDLSAARGSLTPSLTVGVARQDPPLWVLPNNPITFTFSFDPALGPGNTTIFSARMDWVVYRELSTP